MGLGYDITQICQYGACIRGNTNMTIQHNKVGVGHKYVGDASFYKNICISTDRFTTFVIS